MKNVRGLNFRSALIGLLICLDTQWVTLLQAFISNNRVENERPGKKEVNILCVFYVHCCLISKHNTHLKSEYFYDKLD